MFSVRMDVDGESTPVNELWEAAVGVNTCESMAILQAHTDQHSRHL